MSFYYQSPVSGDFERNMRRGIIESAIALNASGVDFATFEESRGNEAFWRRTANGGLQLRPGVSPSDAVMDIFWNGRLYAFECGTAMVIILYKATMDAIGRDAFNRYFKDLFLWDWHVHSNLKMVTIRNMAEVYPGDIVYFKNPDHDPRTPEWQGENAVLLAPGRYYGHGIGITTAEGIIASLNQERVPGSYTSAYLSDDAVHPDFEYLYALSSGRLIPAADNVNSQLTIFARIGVHRYIYNEKGAAGRNF